MSTSDPIIICSTAGTELGDKTIVVYDADVLSLAIKFSEVKLGTLVGADKAAKFRKKLEHAYEDLHDWLTDHGVPNIEHAPHQQNFP
jgi:hypothetical protein